MPSIAPSAISFHLGEALTSWREVMQCTGIIATWARVSRRSPENMGTPHVTRAGRTATVGQRATLIRWPCFFFQRTSPLKLPHSADADEIESCAGRGHLESIGFRPRLQIGRVRRRERRSAGRERRTLEVHLRFDSRTFWMSSKQPAGTGSAAAANRRFRCQSEKCVFLRGPPPVAERSCGITLSAESLLEDDKGGLSVGSEIIGTGFPRSASIQCPRRSIAPHNDRSK